MDDLKKLTKAELIAIITAKTLNEVRLTETVSRLQGELHLVRRTSVSVTKSETHEQSVSFSVALSRAREEAMRTGRVVKVCP